MAHGGIVKPRAGFDEGMAESSLTLGRGCGTMQVRAHHSVEILRITTVRFAWLIPCSVALALSLSSPASAQAPEGKSPEKPAKDSKDTRKAGPAEVDRSPEIKALIKKLGSPEWAVRENARKKLLEIGDEALPLLEKAKTDPDPERSWRSNEIFNAIRWRPPKIFREKVGPIIDDYSTMTKSEKLEFMTELGQLKASDLRSGASFLTKILRFDGDPEIKEAASGLYFKASAPGNPRLDKLVITSLEGLKQVKWTCTDRARLYRRLGQQQPALKAIRQAISIDPKDDASRMLLMTLLIDTKNHAEALPLAQEFAKKQPNSSEALIRLGECLLALGKDEEGIAALKKVLELPGAKSKSENYSGLIRVYLNLKRPKEALGLSKEALGRFPYDHSVNVYHAESEWHAGLKRKALVRFLSELRYAIPGTKPFKMIQVGLTRIFEKAGCGAFVKSPDFWDDLARGRPVARSHERLAHWLEDRGLDELAAQELTFVSLLWNYDSNLRFRLAAVLRRLGRVEQARAVYKDIEKIGKDKERLAQELAELDKKDAKAGAQLVSTRLAGLAFWEQGFFTGKALKAPLRVNSPNSPRPLITKTAAITLKPGQSVLAAYKLDSGKLLWQCALPMPEVKAEALKYKGKGELGLEVVGLISGPSALAMTTAPKRAFENKPVLALAMAVWERENSDDYDWAESSYRGMWLMLVEPKNGRQIGLREIKDAPPPHSKLIVRRCRAVYHSRLSEVRHKLSLIDFAACQEIRHWGLRGKNFTEFEDLGTDILVKYSKGRFLYDCELENSGRGLPKLGIRDQLITDRSGRVLVLMGQGYLLELDSKNLGAKPKILSKSVKVNNSGGWALNQSLLITADREGLVVAYDWQKQLKELWRVKLDRAAERRFIFAGKKIFVVSGLGDLFPGEVPYLIGLHRKDGQVMWKRPFEKPMSLRLSDNHAVLTSGNQANGKIVGVNLTKKLSAQEKKASELKSAAFDAFRAKEKEVATLLFRLYRDHLKDPKAFDLEDRIWYARLLAASNRPALAENVLSEVESEADPEEARRFHELRLEMGLAEEELPEESEQPKDQKGPPKPGKDGKPLKDAKDAKDAKGAKGDKDAKDGKPQKPDGKQPAQVKPAKDQ